MLGDANYIVWQIKKDMVEAFYFLLIDLVETNVLFGGRVIVFSSDLLNFLWLPCDYFCSIIAEKDQFRSFVSLHLDIGLFFPDAVLYVKLQSWNLELSYRFHLIHFSLFVYSNFESIAISTLIFIVSEIRKA